MFQSIGSVVEGKIAQKGLTRSVQAAMVITKATKCGQGRWQATRFRAGRLTLVAPSAIEAQEIQLRRVDITDQINKALGETAVIRLIVRS